MPKMMKWPEKIKCEWCGMPLDDENPENVYALVDSNGRMRRNDEPRLTLTEAKEAGLRIGTFHPTCAASARLERLGGRLGAQ